MSDVAGPLLFEPTGADLTISRRRLRAVVRIPNVMALLAAYSSGKEQVSTSFAIDIAFRVHGGDKLYNIVWGPARGFSLVDLRRKGHAEERKLQGARTLLDTDEVTLSVPKTALPAPMPRGFMWTVSVEQYQQGVIDGSLLIHTTEAACPPGTRAPIPDGTNASPGTTSPLVPTTTPPGGSCNQAAVIAAARSAASLDESYTVTSTNCAAGDDGNRYAGVAFQGSAGYLVLLRRDGAKWVRVATGTDWVSISTETGMSRAVLSRFFPNAVGHGA
jgi:hypothetical protein